MISDLVVTIAGDGRMIAPVTGNFLASVSKEVRGASDAEAMARGDTYNYYVQKKLQQNIDIAN